MPCAEGLPRRSRLSSAWGGSRRATCSTPRCRAASRPRRATSGSSTGKATRPGSTSRSHPMGVVVETRALGWNFPQGNEDIIYFLYTFYNITSTNEADYADVRPSLRPSCWSRPRTFQATNTARFGINLPAEGYAINDLFAAFVADMDVAQADANYATVNVPFALGVHLREHVQQRREPRAGPSRRHLRRRRRSSPASASSASSTSAARTIPTPASRWASPCSAPSPAPPGSLQDPQRREAALPLHHRRPDPDRRRLLAAQSARQSKICFVNISSPADMRFFQSSGPIDLAPGGSGTIVVAYIFAAPVASGGCPGAACDVKPANTNADLTILGDPARMASGVNKIDTMMGYAGQQQRRVRTRRPTRSDPGDPGRVPHRAGLAAAQGADGPVGVRQQVPAALRARAAGVLPGAGQQPGHRALGRLGHREPGQSRSVLRGGASDIDANRCTTRTSGATTSRAIGSIAAGRTTRRELLLIAQFDYAPDADAPGAGIFTGLPRAGEPDAAVRAGARRLHRLRCGCCSRRRRRARRSPVAGPIDLTGTITQVTAGQPGAPGQRRSAAAARRAGHRLLGHRRRPAGPGRHDASLAEHRACRSSSSTAPCGTVCGTSTRSPRST